MNKEKKLQVYANSLEKEPYKFKAEQMKAAQERREYKKSKKFKTE